nr:lipopolysaccharide biosynthesis protein [Chloroflexaceae bacterium]
MISWREVQAALLVVLKWWWVVAASTVLAAGVALFLVLQQPNYYLTRTTLMVGETRNAATPDPQMMGLSVTLANFYAELAKREPILKPVTEKLGIKFGWNVIAGNMLYVSVNRQASLIELTVTDSNPQRAAAIAAAIADELIAYSPNSPDKIAAQQAVIEEQITQTQTNLAAIDRNIDEARAQQTQLRGAADLRDARTRLSELQQLRDNTQETYNQLLRLRNSSVANSLSVFEPATVPQYPMPNRRTLTVATAAGGGFILGLFAVFLLNMIDTRWRDRHDLRLRFGMFDLGVVPNTCPLIQLSPEVARLREPAVRNVHTQILLAALERGNRLLMVSSPYPSEARSALSIDLADMFTRSGYRVLLVDADMEHPHLTNLLDGGFESHESVVHNGEEVEFWTDIRTTPLKNVILLARNVGPDGRPQTPSQPWPTLVKNLQRVADVVILDGPSAMTSADAALLAPVVDGVVLALDPLRDQRSDILTSKQRLLRQRQSNLLGAVVLES